jgi:DNA-binding transcriptional regulator YhcF (GntR family)
MRLWFAPNSEVPVYRQLATQVALAILSGDLQPGARLPSVRDLARRYSLHPNTISTGYRQLEKEGWTEHRHGSGVFVCTKKSDLTPEQLIDYHISGVFRTARDFNIPGELVRSRVAEWLTFPPPDHFLLVDPDPKMRKILLTELASVTQFPVTGVDLEKCTGPEFLTAAIPLCRPSKAALVRDAIPFGYEIVTLPIRSATDWLATWLPVPTTHLIGVVSHWPEFLTTAHTMLVAAGLAPETLVLRDANKPGWNYGLDTMSAIICDVHTAAHRAMPRQPAMRVFPILADDTSEQLARYTNYYRGSSL